MFRKEIVREMATMQMEKWRQIEFEMPWSDVNVVGACTNKVFNWIRKLFDIDLRLKTSESSIRNSLK